MKCTRVCRDCKKTLERIKTDTLEGTNWLYLDEHGRKWYGRICTDCRNVEQRVRYDKFRPENVNKRELLGPEKPEFEGTKRSCPGCGHKTVNRYRCQTCNNQDAHQDNFRGQTAQSCDVWGVTV